MTFARTFVLAAVFTSLIGLAPAPHPTTATTRSVQTLNAHRALIVRTEGDVGFNSDEFYLELNERARQLAAEKRVGTGNHKLGDWFYGGNIPNGFAIDVKLNQLPQPVPPVAAEIADEMVEWLRRYLQKGHERTIEQALQQRERQLRRAQQLATDAEKKLRTTRDMLREVSGRSDVTPATLTAALASMDEDLQRLRLEALAKEARRKAIEEEIAAASARVQKSVESDAIAAELRKVVEAREHAAQTLKKMYESGQASQQDMHDGIARVAEARAKMLQQQRDAAAAAGGSVLESFNKELMTLSIDSRELETKVKYLDERLPRLREAVEHVDEYRFAEQEAREANNRLAETTRDMQELRLRLENLQPPRVLIKESENERQQ